MYVCMCVVLCCWCACVFCCISQQSEALRVRWRWRLCVVLSERSLSAPGFFQPRLVSSNNPPPPPPPHVHVVYIMCHPQLCAPPVVRGVVGVATLLRPHPVRFFTTTMPRPQNRTLWKQTDKYTVRPIGVKKTGGRDYTGRPVSHSYLSVSPDSPVSPVCVVR